MAELDNKPLFYIQFGDKIYVDHDGNLLFDKEDAQKILDICLEAVDYGFNSDDKEMLREAIFAAEHTRVIPYWKQ